MFSALGKTLRAAQSVIVFALVVMATAIGRADFGSFPVGGDATIASIQAAVGEFRLTLGNPNNANDPGTVGGRREINWDGGGATTASPVPTPFTGFQNTRGALFTTPGTGFLQTPLDAPELAAINATYATEFGFFSPSRIFTPIGSNITDVTFSIPGTNGATQATVSGFGAVFSDVDLEATTKMEFFNLGGSSIFTAFAPPDTVTDAGLSFIGAFANAGERIARVRITTGNSPLGPDDQNGDNVDVVVMDDFIYSEPVAVPEPTTLVLMVFGSTFVAFTRRSRRRRESPRP